MRARISVLGPSYKERGYLCPLAMMFFVDSPVLDFIHVKTMYVAHLWFVLGKNSFLNRLLTYTIFLDVFLKDWQGG